MVLLNLSSAVFLGAINLLLGQSSSVLKSRDPNTPVGYTDVKLALSNEIRVPLHLPTYIPFTGDAQHPVFAILEKRDLRNYKIQLAWAKDCTGGNWCHLGSIQGSSTSISLEGRRTPVPLRKGIQGYFVQSHCYEYCTEAILSWTQNAYHYSVGIKAGDEKTLLRMANSATALTR